jgi:hypothetical protein
MMIFEMENTLQNILLPPSQLGRKRRMQNGYGLDEHFFTTVLAPAIKVQYPELIIVRDALRDPNYMPRRSQIKHSRAEHRFMVEFPAECAWG